MNIKFSKKFLALALVGTFAIAGTKVGDIEQDKKIVEDVNYDDEYELIDSKQVETLEIGTGKREMTKDDLVMNVKKYVTALENVNIRESNSEESEKIGLLTKGNSLIMKKRTEDGWYKVKYNDTDSYVSASYVEESNKTEVVNDVIKVVYFDEDSSIYDDKKFENSISDIKKYQTANVYFENDDSYIAMVDGNVGYIKKQDVKELNDTYVVVDISDQELNLYQDDEVVLTTPVVTGKPSTPTNEGLFDIYSITTHRDLIGKNNSYRSYVDVMMSFDGGIGLHDAEFHDDYDSNGRLVKHHGWRNLSAFGGSTYLYNGSHGCVNMPHDAAMDVYEKVEIGTKVLVKE